MNAAPDRFAAPAEADVTRLVLGHPLAWVVSMAAAEFRATPLPLRALPVAADQPITTLVGHFARSNAHVELLRRAPRALLLFMGPNGYISPSWMHDRSQAPTWNYATVQYLVEVEFVDDNLTRDRALEDLTGAMETGRPNAWRPGDMGPRYETLAARVQVFRARVVERRLKFKLGQDERDDVYADISAALAGGDADLHAWMQRSNPRRDGR